MQSKDNEILISTIREVATHLVKHHVPKLKSWKQSLLAALPLAATTTTSSSSSSLNNLNTTTTQKEEEDTKDEETERAERQGKRQKRDDAIQSIHIQKALTDIDRLVVACAEILCGKCKKLLMTTN
jgi:hypothetical protein